MTRGLTIEYQAPKKYAAALVKLIDKICSATLRRIESVKTQRQIHRSIELPASLPSAKRLQFSGTCLLDRRVTYQEKKPALET
jgi:hypothetical protein